VIGIIGEKGSGQGALLRVAAGFDQPSAGQVVFHGSRRYVGPTGELDLSPVDLLLIEHSLASLDAFAETQTLVGIDRLRSDGGTVLVVSHQLDLLQRLCDEVWWLEAGKLARRGDPREALDAYRGHITAKFRAWGATLPNPIRPALRRGDGRAEIVALETLNAADTPTGVWQSGEDVIVRVRVRYRDAVENPVIGIMIRTRVGLNVYGTNTELENVKAGPCAASDVIQLDFRFRCELCPGEYTLTAASHDPDGTAHDWVDDAVAFVVADSRYTAGVANLRAKVVLRDRGQTDLSTRDGI
jgi:lipopolysaccharide transport system ATP-binding protein